MRTVFLIAVLMAGPAFAADTPPSFKPDDKFTVTLTAQQWRSVAASVQDSSVMSAHDAKALSDLIISQLEAEASKKAPAK